VSKRSRRRQQPGSQPSTARPTTPPPGDASVGTPSSQPAPAAGPPPPAGGSSTSAGPPPPAGGSSTSAVGAPSTAGAPRPSGTTSTAGTPRPSGTSTRPVGGARAGRRERQRTAYQQSFLERHRTPIVVLAALAGVALISVFVFFSASQPAFACSTIWTPAPTASPAAGATPALGYVQPLMGHAHVDPGDKVTYTYCAPASGNHIFRDGQGPIAARVYGPNDNVIPQGWIHNLEHGGLVILYRGTSAGATPEGQAALKAYHAAFPPATNCGPVIARFDQMSSPFQAILWGRVLLLDTFDQAMVTAFWNQWGGLTNPEQACPVPNNPVPSSSPSVSTAPSSTPAGSPTPAPSPSGSATPSAAPSTSAAPAPSVSVAPSAS
jgi:hypothetical protein